MTDALLEEDKEFFTDPVIITTAATVARNQKRFSILMALGFLAVVSLMVGVQRMTSAIHKTNNLVHEVEQQNRVFSSALKQTTNIINVSLRSRQKYQQQQRIMECQVFATQGLISPYCVDNNHNGIPDSVDYKEK